MNNFKLTNKEEVLSYLENQKISLQKEKKMCKFSIMFSAAASFLNAIAIASSPFFAPFVLANAGFAIASLGSIYLRHIDMKNCEYKLQKTEQKIGRIKEGSLTNSMMVELEEEVVKARNEKSPMTKTMMTRGSK